MKLFYDPDDRPIAQRLNDPRLNWLADLDAVPIQSANVNDEGFLFGYAHDDNYLNKITGPRPGIRDQPGERDSLLDLDRILGRLKRHQIDVPTPKTWVIEVDQSLPEDVTFPLFTRTPRTSWKRGGPQGRVNNAKEFSEEAELLRRAFGWDTRIVAREWLSIAKAGTWMFGDAPQEVRVWIVDGTAKAWSFHYIHAVPQPRGFPPQQDELAQLKKWANQIATVFESRLMVADFVRDEHGQWHFMEAGPGAAAGTGHEQVFKYVANWMIGAPPSSDVDFGTTGGVF